MIFGLPTNCSKSMVFGGRLASGLTGDADIAYLEGTENATPLPGSSTTKQRFGAHN